MDPSPFLRGNPFPATSRDPYPRAKPGDGRVPADTWFMATVPAGVRLEFAGDASEVEIAYVARANEGWQRPAFESWSPTEPLSTADVTEGTGTVRLACARRTIVYLPERMRPRITSIEAIGGPIAPATPAPRWLCYGDSIAEGWNASMPSRAWPAVVAREHDLDVVNMGYAGAARGELALAEQIAELPADVISVTYGTNCWSRVPFTTGLMRETLHAFLDVVRTGHPETPIVVQSMLLRPEAEHQANGVGATHAELRAAMEDVVLSRIDHGDKRLRLIEGLPIIDASMLDDGVHPDDTGHRAVADVLGPILAEA
jgi:lysophospholipase L1-like esterase